MEKVISGRTILLNTHLNTTFIANDTDAQIGIRDDGKIEWAGELTVPVCEHQYRPISERLWQLLDDIDTASDMFKPSESNGIKSYGNFYRYVMKKQKERWKYLATEEAEPEILVRNIFPEPELIDSRYIRIARKMMKEIMYDNGMVNRFKPEEYPEEHVNSISKSAGIFFDAHPELLTDEDINNICCGFVEDNEKKYAIYPEYKQMSIDLNEFFDPGSSK